MASSSRRSAVLVLTIILVCGCVGMLFGQRLTATALPERRRLRDSLRELYARSTILSSRTTPSR